MKSRVKKKNACSVAYQRAKASRGGFVRAEDLPGVTPAAASKALSRLASSGVLVRAGKGLYYLPHETLLGKSKPAPLAVVQEKYGERSRPTGHTAANLLGLTTQVPARPELALYSTAVPKTFPSASVTLRKRTQTQPVDVTFGAVLETLRNGGRFSELDDVETVAQVRKVLSQGYVNGRTRLRNCVQVALGEPPRVRAILGALLEDSGYRAGLWKPLRTSLNPLSRFKFGVFACLPNACSWQAK